jgi:hypothetical protein
MNKHNSNLSIKRHFLSRKVLFLILTISLLVLAGAVAFMLISKERIDNQTKTSDTSGLDKNRHTGSGLPGSDYSSGSKFHADDADEVHTHDPNSDSTPPSTSRKPSIEIANLAENNGTIEIAARLLNINDSGKCIFTFSKTGEKSVIKEVPSDKKICTIQAKSSEFSKLDIWTLNIAFYKNSMKITDTNINVTVN